MHRGHVFLRYPNTGAASVTRSSNASVSEDVANVDLRLFSESINQYLKY